MAATLALVAAFLFALAAALQQKGALNLPTISLADPKSLVRLVGQTMWLLGTVALFTGYLFQAAALDRGRLSVIQPLLVTTVVFALPLGYFLTRQHVGRREVLGSVVIIFGLGLFVYFGDPAGGNENASNLQWAVTIGLLSVLSVLLIVLGSGGGLSKKAAVYGTVAGILFGLSSALTKPTSSSPSVPGDAARRAVQRRPTKRDISCVDRLTSRPGNRGCRTRSRGAARSRSAPGQTRRGGS
jgi:drug/metabolite transporter (DMT)-like permease